MMLKTFSFIILLSFSSTKLYAQLNEFSNSFESHLSSIFEFNPMNNGEYVTGSGFGISFHRTILHHQVFNVYFGLEINYFELHIMNTYPSEEAFHFYSLLSVQKFYPTGVLIGNRFSSNFNKVNIFLDTEISSNVIIRTDINTDLRHLRIGFDYAVLPSPINQSGDYLLSQILFKFGIRTGLEYVFPKRFILFVSPSWFKTLNSIFQQTEISPNIPTVDKKYLDIVSLSLGVRF